MPIAVFAAIDGRGEQTAASTAKRKIIGGCRAWPERGVLGRLGGRQAEPSKTAGAGRDLAHLRLGDRLGEVEKPKSPIHHFTLFLVVVRKLCR